MKQLQGMKSDEVFDLGLSTARTTLALKTRVPYGACGDAGRLRDAATARHARLPELMVAEQHILSVHTMLFCVRSGLA